MSADDQSKGSWQRPPFSLTLFLLVMGVAVPAAVLPTLFSQSPPAIPAPVLVDPKHPLAPAPTATPAATPEAALPTDPNSTPPPLAPGTINGNPIRPMLGPGQVPPTLGGAQPMPIAIPATVMLDFKGKHGSGLGPSISVSTKTHGFSRAGLPARNWIDQTQDQADSKSAGCLQCHAGVEPMHKSEYVVLGCTDCHGGNAKRGLTIQEAHIQPAFPEYWRSSANPIESSTILNHERPEFVRFINPGDLRVAEQACGLCHMDSLKHVANSMMTTGQMLWGAALYNNGGYPLKNYVFGQSYGRDGAPLKITNPFPVTAEMMRRNGMLPFLIPLPRFNLGQPGNTLRIFEKGGLNPPPLGSPEAEERPGAPERGLSARGFGTLLRTDPVFLGIQKTRLNDPLLGFLGANDHPGDYRSSGCTACHTIYANDRSPTNSGWYAQYGHQGLSFSADKTMKKNERGHPITHQFTRSIPSSQCMNCHMHQGNLFVNPYLGYTWWDQESDGEVMYPKKQHNPTDEEFVLGTRHNPEAAATRGLWGDLSFLEKVSELNPKLHNTQFADYHGHGWIFRAIFKKDKKGNLLDLQDNKIAANDPRKWQKAVHLKDIHLQNGMQCVDCHFLQDMHGDGTIYNEPRAATSIECIDCHGTVDKRPTLITSGNGGHVNIGEGSSPWGPRFEWKDETQPTTETVDGKPVERFVTRKVLYQWSNMDPNKRWEVPQTIDTVDPTSRWYNPKSAYAKTLHRDGKTWGDVPASAGDRHSTFAHDNDAITCQVCHSSWATSCFGCHLPLQSNRKVPLNKFEGTTDRNYTTYNPQVVRDDVFMLGIDGTVKNHRMAVLRSSSAVIVSSQNSNREWVYSQQQTVSAEGYSGQAFNPHFPHTTSSVGTTKGCTDCHLSAARDNNAWMAQLLGFGTGTVNFFGRYAWVGAGEEGVHGVVWTEQEEPQAAIGSHLQKLAYPDNYAAHLANDSQLKTAYEHHGKDIRDLTQRGEYLYTADGKDGFRIYDIANIDNKAFSERISTSVLSPLGQNTHVQTKGIATALALPSTLGLDPLRKHIKENEETPIPLYYGFIYGTDTVEGLVDILVGCLVDGDPGNNYLKKDVTFNPDGLLTGATHLVTAGYRLYITSPSGLSVVSVLDPMHPKLLGHYGGSFLRNPKAVAVQFQYAFVTDEEGLKIFNISDPDRPVPVSGGMVHLEEAGRLYVARTYAYVPDGKEGLAIIDVENPERPHLVQMYNAEGRMNDVKAVQIGSISASMFALVADGKNGFRVVQMISPENVPENAGFSPRPNPILISTYKLEGEVIAIGRGLDRDRVVDETGAQTVVFGRRGSRPFNVAEMQPFLRHGASKVARDEPSLSGSFYRVDDVTVKKDGAGKKMLLTSNGSSLASPLAFRDPSLPAATPALAPGAPGEIPIERNEFMQPAAVKELLKTSDPYATPTPQPLPIPKPTPVEPGSFQQPGTAEQLLRARDAAAPTAPTRGAAPQPTPAPGGSTPVPDSTSSDPNSFLQPGAVDRLIRTRDATPRPAVPTGSPR